MLGIKETCENCKNQYICKHIADMKESIRKTNEFKKQFELSETPISISVKCKYFSNSFTMGSNINILGGKINE